MKLRKFLTLFAVATSAFATVGSAQVFWSNYSPAGIADNIWCVTYANNTFAAVTDRGNLLTSSNGLNWSSQAVDPGVWLVSITYGNNTWVVVGGNGTILVSTDLKTWSHATSGTTNTLNGVLYNGIVWVAVGETGTIVTSSDAQNWALQPAVPGVTGFLHGIALVPSGLADHGIEGPVDNFLVCGANGVLLEAPSTGVGFNIAFPSVGNPPTQNLEAILNVASVSGISVSEKAVAVGQGALLESPTALGTGTAIAANDFAESPSSIPNVDFRGLAYGNGFWVAAGEQGAIFRSADGVNWVQSYAGDSPSTLSTATLLSAAYSPTLQRFVVTGTGGTILVSNAAPTVFANISTRGYVSSSQTFIGGFVIEGAAPRTVLIRADGPVLGTFNVAGPLADPVLTVYDSGGAVVATNTGWTTNTNPSALSTAALEVGAFALPNPGKDSALLLTLPPGPYTAQITSASGGSGIALFEAYTN